MVAKLSTNLATKEGSGDDSYLVIRKYQKTQYAPGGSTNREEYMPKIPTISACCFNEEHEILVVSFADCDIKLFRLKGMSQKDQLDIDHIPKSYNGQFICNNIALGLHQATHEFIGIFVGSGQMHVVNLHPESHKFMEVLTKIQLPMKKRLSSDPNSNMNEQPELATSINFDENIGTFVTFYTGFFKVFEPILFRETLTQECQSNLEDAKGRKPGEAPKREISITCSDLSKKSHVLAIGGHQGNIKFFDATSKTFFDNDSDIHHSEMMSLFFFDEEA